MLPGGGEVDRRSSAPGRGMRVPVEIRVKERHAFAHVLPNMLRSHIVLFLAFASTYALSRRTSCIIRAKTKL